MINEVDWLVGCLKTAVELELDSTLLFVCRQFAYRDAGLTDIFDLQTTPRYPLILLRQRLLGVERTRSMHAC